MAQGNFCFVLDVTLFIHYYNIYITESIKHLTRGRSIRSYSPRSIWSVFYNKSTEGEISNLSLGFCLAHLRSLGSSLFQDFFGQLFKDADSFGFHSSCSLENRFLCVVTGKRTHNCCNCFGVPSCLVGRAVRWARSISGTGTIFNLSTRTFLAFS